VQISSWSKALWNGPSLTVAALFRGSGRETMFKRSHYVAFGLVALLTLVILNLPAGISAGVRRVVASMFVPLVGLTTATKQSVSQTVDAVTPRRELLRQNEALRQENQELRLELARGQDSQLENQRFRQHFAWQQRALWKVRLARVVLREPANWWRTVQIDFGSRNGAKINMPVLTSDGFLAGRISSVSLTRSEVVLLGDPNCKVAARVENEAGDTGVIGASGPLHGNFVELAYLSRSANVKPGQQVKTSGLGGIFPRDIPLGQVVDAQPVEYGLGILAQVKLAANLGALSEVWVLISSGKES
jgi:rod shape-determining protein MreC